jgi:hypothetical protein
MIYARIRVCTIVPTIIPTQIPYKNVKLRKCRMHMNQYNVVQ